MIILGIDPGSSRLGWGVIEKTGSKIRLVDYGCIEPAREIMSGVRLSFLYQELQKIIDHYQPESAGVELLFFAKNAKTVMSIAEVRGVILLLLSQNKLKISEFTPYQIKQIVTGYGSADKKQIQKMIKMTLKLEETPKPDDAADGIAIAIATAQSLRYNL